ncbi:hypothetical protein RB614_02890 [Phytohabitans sp. ZYX-F-186]|uniref:Gram-positive cocci surface proteins LPxTG domain-containing protein n=1 Tax=Phytohabitans maris TaxID=3071409 RepID=A0ABU0Z8S7_9ACTN|nr:hypothetical protein [Phytohabitans sp. ZYX-F-186]MDQ7903460.1 hypothetical protein [Phytohabitans sp. ZYX-F-186]
MTSRKRQVARSIDLTREPNSYSPNDPTFVRAPEPNQLTLNADLEQRRLGLRLKANQSLDDAVTYLLICVGAALLATGPAAAGLGAQAPYWAVLATSAGVCLSALGAGLAFAWRRRRP